MHNSLRCLPVPDSNIPLRKKKQNLCGRSPNGHRKLPELQKYIEVIVSGKERLRNATEDGCSTETKTPNNKTNYCCWKSENQNKHDSYKEVCPLWSRQSGSKTRGKRTRSGGRRSEGTLKRVNRVFENPQRREKSQAVFSLVGKFLESLYPNPYDMGKRMNLTSPKTRQKSAGGKLKKSATVVNLLLVTRGGKNGKTPGTKKSSNFGPKINQIASQENKALTPKTPRDSESCIKSCLFEDKSCVESLPNKASIKTATWNNSRLLPNSRGFTQGDQSMLRNNSRSSYCRKYSREGCERGSRGSVNDKRNLKTEKKTGVSDKAEGMTKKPMEKEDLRGLSDIDFGKLKLLTSNYLSDAIRRNSEMQKKNNLESDIFKCDPVFLLQNSGNLKNLKKTPESINLCQSEDLKKEQEKFTITADSANEKNFNNPKSECEYSNENRKLVQYLNEVNLSKTLAQREEDERNFGFSSRKSESSALIEEIDKESFCKVSNKKIELEVKSSSAVGLNEDGPGEGKSEGERKQETRDVEIEEERSFSEKFLEGSEELTESRGHQKFYETSKKIDDVLKFMYNCLLKFNNECNLNVDHTELTKQCLVSKCLEENPKSELPSQTSADFFLKVASMEKVCQIQSVPVVKDWLAPGTSDLSTEFGESSKQYRPSSKKRQRVSEHTSRSHRGIDKNIFQISTPRAETRTDPENPRTLLCESVEVNPQTGVQTVEVQNELGGFSEEALVVPNEDPKLSKAILPHSVKFRNRKNDACEVIKNALETEEKLLAEGSTSKEHTEKEITRNEVLRHRSPLGPLTAEKILLTSYTPDQVGVNSLLKGVNPSCFVICVNSLPNNLLPMVSSPLSISLKKASSLDLRNRQLLEFSPSKLCVSRESVPEVSHYAYCFKKEFLRLLNKSIVAQVARVVCLIFISRMAKSEPQISPENSQCLIDFLFAPKKLMFEEPISCLIRGVSYSFEQKTVNLRSEVLKVQFLSKQKNLDKETRKKLKLKKNTKEKEEESGKEKKNEEKKPVRDLNNSVEETEGKLLFLLENKEPAGNVEKSTCIERLVNHNSGSAGNEREKIHDLLLRTCSLQNKLHNYLHKISCLQASSASSCPLLHHKTFLDFGVLFKQSTEVFPMEAIERQPGPSHSMICWPSETSTRKETKVEKAMEKVQIFGHCSSCHPAFQAKAEKGPEKKETTPEEEVSPSYRSSDCSTKSSSDLSGDISNEDESSRDCNKILNKIFSELEICRRNRPKKEEIKPEDLNSENNNCELEDNGEPEPSKQDAKGPPKVLKTLFRGKESLTELSMGLKDFSLSEVSNISVEKKKLSANHTKISICISKRKTDEIEKSSQAQSSSFQINSEVQSNFSFCNFDSLRPGLSTCRTEYFRLENDSGKTSSEEDEDDFKSVASSLTSSYTDTEEEEKPEEKKLEEEKPEEKKNDHGEVSPSTPFEQTSITHQFDFCRNMTESGTRAKTAPDPATNTVCDYKELEQEVTDMQVRMSSINGNSFFNTDECYKKALKLAKMSSGYCQNCGNQSVIPDDTFGVYKSLLPSECSTYSRDCFFRNSPSFYSFRSRNRDLSDHLLDVNVNQSSCNLLNGPPVQLRPF